MAATLALLLWHASVRAGRGAHLVAWALALLGVGNLSARQFAAEANRRAVEERWEWDGEAIGVMLRRAFAAQAPLLAADPAGSVPYSSGCHRFSASVSGGPVTFELVESGRTTPLVAGATFEVPAAGERPTLRATVPASPAVVREVRFSPCAATLGTPS